MRADARSPSEETGGGVSDFARGVHPEHDFEVEEFLKTTSPRRFVTSNVSKGVRVEVRANLCVCARFAGSRTQRAYTR